MVFGLWKWCGRTSPKVIGLGYLLLGGFGGLLGWSFRGLIRVALAAPDYSCSCYHARVTLHALLMVFFLVMPVLMRRLGN